MTDYTSLPIVPIRRSAHGKPYFEDAVGLGDDLGDSPLHDALDFPGKDALDDFGAALKDKYPGIAVSRDGARHDYIAEIRSIDREVDRDEFQYCWRFQLKFAMIEGFNEVKDPFLRIVPVRLSGKDRVRWWSGWFHYQWLIENSRREMEESGKRLQSLFDSPHPRRRNVVEEAYYEQVQRRRLAIFERRREWWRVVRWGLTTVLGGVLTLWSGIQIWDRFFGG